VRPVGAALIAAAFGFSTHLPMAAMALIRFHALRWNA
jgi:hypothetical protein